MITIFSRCYACGDEADSYVSLDGAVYFFCEDCESQHIEGNAFFSSQTSAANQSSDGENEEKTE